MKRYVRWFPTLRALQATVDELQAERDQLSRDLRNAEAHRDYWQGAAETLFVEMLEVVK